MNPNHFYDNMPCYVHIHGSIWIQGRMRLYMSGYFVFHSDDGREWVGLDHSFITPKVM